MATTVPAGTPAETAVEDELRDDLHRGALTRAEERLAKVSDPAVAAQAKAEILRQRRETGLPSDRTRSRVLAEDEPAVREAYVMAMQLLGAGNVDGARTILADTTKRFPEALPVLVLTCCVEGWASHAAKARKACASALRRWDEIPFAHFWMGQFANDIREQIAHHRRVLELDPTVEGSWQALAQLYEHRGDKTAANEIRAQFQARFHHSLPR